MSDRGYSIHKGVLLANRSEKENFINGGLLKKEEIQGE